MQSLFSIIALMPVDVLYAEKRAEILVAVQVLNLSDMTAFFWLCALGLSVRNPCVSFQRETWAM